jgi:hypothetical protein
MITTFEVGAVFKIINEASPALAAILKEVRSLNTAITKAKEGLASIGLSVSTIKLGTAVAETDALAASWGLVAKNAASARLAMGSAATVAARAPGTSAGAGRHRPGWLSGGGAHIGGPSVPVPGGSHIRLGRGAGIAALGLAGYGVEQAAGVEDYVWQMIYHSGLEHDEATKSKFRKVLQDATIATGFNMHDVGEAALQEIRMMQGTKDGGIGSLSTFLNVAGTEARAKGSTLAESMTSFLGLAHMTKSYDPAAIEKLAPAFAFLSTADPRSLSSMERAAGYALPSLQSGLEIDPMTALLSGTALARAGVTNSKSGTWLREMATRAMPGTTMMSKMAYKKHEEALKAFGLEDDAGKPTWFDDKGKPDLLKMLGIAGPRAAAIPLDKRAAYERALFGAQGSGAFGVLSDPKVMEQVNELNRMRQDPAFLNRYHSFMPDYAAGSTKQDARTALQEFNAVSADLGKDVLPSVNVALHNFKSILEGIRGVLPGTTNDGRYGGAALTGAAIGVPIGFFAGGPVGAAIGGVAGGTLGVAAAYMQNLHEPHDRFGRETVITGNSAAQAAEGMKALGESIRGLPSGRGSIFPGGSSPAPAPITLNLNVDGRTLASAISSSQNGMFTDQAPAFDGFGKYTGGDMQHTDK